MFSSGNCASVPLVASLNGNGNGSGNGGNGNGLFDNGAWIIIILFLFVFLGWGNNWGGNGNNGGNGGGGAMPTYIPIPTNVGGSCDSEVQRGFNQQAVVTKLDGITQGICDSTYAVTNQLTSGFAGVNQALCNGFNNVNTAMLQGFNSTNVALMQGQNALQAQAADCCCKNQIGQMQIQNQMAADTCALQNTMNVNARDEIENTNSGIRAIMDKLSQMEYNSLNDKYQAVLADNQTLRTAQNITNQNAYLTATMDANRAELIRRLGADCPIPAYVVPNPNCCYGTPYGVLNNGCGCNSGCGCA